MENLLEQKTLIALKNKSFGKMFAWKTTYIVKLIALKKIK
jgi:hypothetical protein